MPVFRTLAGPVRHEIPRVKGSRFLADAAPARSADEALAVVEAARAELAQATHHCFAWRLGLGALGYRTSDDGEPSGTAGLPILRQIDGHGVTDVVVVVTRWFGGTKLGTGPLARAYGAAAAAVLGEAEVVEARVCQTVEVRCAYALQGTVRGAMAAAGLAPDREAFGEDVRFVLAVPVEQVDAFVADVRERTAGRAQVSSTPA